MAITNLMYHLNTVELLKFINSLNWSLFRRSRQNPYLLCILQVFTPDMLQNYGNWRKGREDMFSLLQGCELQNELRTTYRVH